MEFFQANIKLGEVLVQLIAFVIVFLTLKKLAWGPLQQSLESRRERIKGDFEKIEQLKKEVEALKLEYGAHMKRIDEESRGKIQEAVEEGRRLSRELQEQAKAESQAGLEKAKETLNLEIAKARLTLRRELADLAVGVAEKVLDEKLTDARQQEKVMEIIQSLEKSK